MLKIDNRLLDPLRKVHTMHRILPGKGVLIEKMIRPVVGLLIEQPALPEKLAGDVIKPVPLSGCPPRRFPEGVMSQDVRAAPAS